MYIYTYTYARMFAYAKVCVKTCECVPVYMYEQIAPGYSVGDPCVRRLHSSLFIREYDMSDKTARCVSRVYSATPRSVLKNNLGKSWY